MQGGAVGGDEQGADVAAHVIRGDKMAEFVVKGLLGVRVKAPLDIHAEGRCRARCWRWGDIAVAS